MKFFLSKYKVPVHILPILVIFLVTAIYIWPLLSQLTFVIPGRFELTDATETVWSVGWVYQALSNGENFWHTDRLFIPYGADLRFNVCGLLQGLIAFPFVAPLGVVGASNLVIIITMFLNGIFAYFLVWNYIGHPTAALLASICNVLSLAVVWHFSAGRNALPALWVVFSSLLCLKTLLDNPTIWKGLLFGISLAAAFFTDLQITVFTCLWVLLCLIAYFWNNNFIKSLRSLFAPLLIAASIFLFVVCFVLLPVIPILSQGDFSTPPLNDAAYYALSIKDFFSPQKIPYIYGFDFLVSTILAVFLFGWQGTYRFWLLGSFIFLILSLGPYLKPTHIPLPYALASVWPPSLNFRSTYRFVIPATIGLTVVMGHLLAALLPKESARAVVIITCAIFISLRLWYTIQLQPFETQIYPDYNFYREINRDSEDYVILEIPFGIRSGLDQIGQGRERLQYYQHVHGKRILNGSLARLPVSLFAFYRGHPVLMFFSGNMFIDRSKLRNDFSGVLEWAKPRYILVHRSLLSVEQAKDIELFLNNQPQLKRTNLENDLVIYNVIP